MIPKFRAWDKEHDEMLYPDDVDKIYFELTVDGIVTYDMRYILPYDDIPPYLDTVIMQSTGLHDKNGKEIFEGDIVKVSQDDDYFISFVKNMIKFDCPGFDVPFPDDWYYECNVLSHLMNTDQTIEVISNIHEHPELLNQPNE